MDNNNSELQVKKGMEKNEGEGVDIRRSEKVEDKKAIEGMQLI